MELFINNKSGAPIYDQIYNQIKQQIISGALQPDEAMPSIRGLARDLRISVITTKRAYDESVAMILMGTFFMKEGSNFFMLYGGLLLGLSPMSLLAYDQSSRFSICSAALPVTKEQLVGGKYLIGLCGMALAELLSMAALAAAQLLWGTVTVKLTVATLLQVAMLTLLGNIILLPLTYRFGYEKAKYVYYLCIGMLGALMGITVSSGGILLNSILPAHSSALVGVVVLAAVLALYALSWRLSVAWYGKAEQ